MTLSEKQWAEMQSQGESIRRDDDGERIVKAAQDSVAPMLAEADEIHKDFLKVKRPALELVARVEKCQPLSRSAGVVLVDDIGWMVNELRRICLLFEEGNFNKLKRFVADITPEAAQRYAHSAENFGEGFQDRVECEVNNLRALVGRVVERTGALEAKMEEYFHRRGTLPAASHDSKHPEPRGVPLSTNSEFDARKPIAAR